MSTKRAEPVVGVEVHALGNPKKLGVIISTNGNYVDVEWGDGTVTNVHCYLLADVATKRRAAERALQRWT